MSDAIKRVAAFVEARGKRSPAFGADRIATNYNTQDDISLCTDDLRELCDEIERLRGVVSEMADALEAILDADQLSGGELAGAIEDAEAALAKAGR